MPTTQPVPQGNLKGRPKSSAIVRERQLVFHVQDLGAPMQVNAKVAESIVHKVQPGQKAQIVVDAFPGAKFTGTVTQVVPLPDPGSPGGGRKVYPTTICWMDPMRVSARA